MTQDSNQTPPPVDYQTPPPSGMFAPPPAPVVEVPKDARTWGMLCHLCALAGFLVPLGTFLGPLIIWLIKKSEYQFADDQGKESLNFQISMLILAIVLLPTICIGVGVVLLPLVGVVDLIFVIIASIKANDGVWYR